MIIFLGLSLPLYHFSLGYVFHPWYIPNLINRLYYWSILFPLVYPYSLGLV